MRYIWKEVNIVPAICHRMNGNNGGKVIVHPEAHPTRQQLVQVCIIRVEAEQRRVRIPVRTEIRREERTVPIVIPRIEPAAMIPMMMAMTMFIWMMIMMTTGMSMMMITGMV